MNHYTSKIGLLQEKLAAEEAALERVLLVSAVRTGDNLFSAIVDLGVVSPPNPRLESLIVTLSVAADLVYVEWVQAQKARVTRAAQAAMAEQLRIEALARGMNDPVVEIGPVGFAPMVRERESKA